LTAPILNQMIAYGTRKIGRVGRQALKTMALAKDLSIHSAAIEEVHEVPMEVIIRPFKSELDERKVNSLMETLQVEAFFTQHLRLFFRLFSNLLLLFFKFFFISIIKLSQKYLLHRS